MQALRPTQYRGPLAATCRATSRRALSIRSAVSMSSPQQVLAAGSAEPEAGPDRQRPLFITTWSCPYAQRTWIALNAKQLQYTPVFVDLTNKPEWFFKHNEYGRVPTLVWKEDGKEGTQSLYESLICNEYINDLPGPSLLPADPVERARARLIIDQFAAKFGAAFGKVMFASDAAAAAPAAADLATALHWLEGQASSEGPYLLGADFGLVDAALIPFFIRLQLIEKMGYFTTPTADLPKLSAWQSACVAHPAVTGSLAPPDASKPYIDQLYDNYQEFIAKRRAAAAAAN